MTSATRQVHFKHYLAPHRTVTQITNNQISASNPCNHYSKIQHILLCSLKQISPMADPVIHSKKGKECVYWSTYFSSHQEMLFTSFIQLHMVIRTNTKLYVQHYIFGFLWEKHQQYIDSNFQTQIL